MVCNVTENGDMCTYNSVYCLYYANELYWASQWIICISFTTNNMQSYMTCIIYNIIKLSHCRHSHKQSLTVHAVAIKPAHTLQLILTASVYAMFNGGYY